MQRKVFPNITLKTRPAHPNFPEYRNRLGESLKMCQAHCGQRSLKAMSKNNRAGPKNNPNDAAAATVMDGFAPSTTSVFMKITNTANVIKQAHANTTDTAAIRNVTARGKTWAASVTNDLDGGRYRRSIHWARRDATMPPTREARKATTNGFNVQHPRL